jgi:hydrogenase expression/formation protein HypC
MCLGVPGRIVEVYDSGGLKMGRIDFGGVLREACLAYVPEAVAGDYAIVHVGFALSLLSEEEANETLALLREIMDVEAELGSNAEAPAGTGPAAGAGGSAPIASGSPTTVSAVSPTTVSAGPASVPPPAGAGRP